MTIRVKYFASLRDRLGRSEDRLQATEELTAAEVWRRLHPDTALPPNTLIAINMEYAGPDQQVSEGDEVAFFPPVTGG